MVSASTQDHAPPRDDRPVLLNDQAPCAPPLEQCTPQPGQHAPQPVQYPPAQPQWQGAQQPAPGYVTHAVDSKMGTDNEMWMCCVFTCCCTLFGLLSAFVCMDTVKAKFGSLNGALIAMCFALGYGITTVIVCLSNGDGRCVGIYGTCIVIWAIILAMVVHVRPKWKQQVDAAAAPVVVVQGALVMM